MNAESGPAGARCCASSVVFIVLTVATAGLWPEVVIGEFAPNCPSEPFSDNELTLVRAVDLALCSNAEIQSAAAAVRIRAAQLGQARAPYWPTLTASATELRESTQYPASHSSSTTDTATTVYGALSWRLLDFGGRRADVRAASRLLEAAFASQDATIGRVASGWN